MALFTIKIELKGEGEKYVHYDTMDAFLNDEGLEALFKDKLVTSCTVLSGGQRITGLPQMDWARLVDQVVSNSTTILRAHVAC